MCDSTQQVAVSYATEEPNVIPCGSLRVAIESWAGDFLGRNAGGNGMALL